MEGEEFLDPYADDVEACLVHLGPLVYWQAGHARAETTIRILDLDSGKRTAIIDRKCDVLEKARALLENVSAATSDVLRELRRDEVIRMCRVDAEYSAMVSAYVRLAPTTQA